MTLLRDPEDDDPYAYEPVYVEAEPAVRLAGVFVLLNATFAFVLIVLRQAALVYGPRAQLGVRDVVALLIDVALGALLCLGISKVRLWTLLRAGAGVALPLALALFSDEEPWAPNAALAAVEALYLGSLCAALLGSPKLARKVLAGALFVLHGFVMVAIGAGYAWRSSR
jgi:hypothetical protein